MPSNKMTSLLNKIERRLGTKPLNLSENIQKDKWAEVIEDDTLVTFSRYYPNILNIELDLSQRKPGGYYIIDEYVPKGVEVLGVRDIDWTAFSQASVRMQQASGYDIYNLMIDNYNVTDVALLQMRNDHMSLFNNQLFVEFKAPNMVKITNVTGTDVIRGIRNFPLTLFIKHASNLMTIPPTMMEIFESLAQSDIANFIYQDLKYYEGLNTATAQFDLKLDDLRSWADKRDDIINTIKESYVSASNQYQPMIFTI